MGQSFVEGSNLLLALALDFDRIRSEYSLSVAGLAAGIAGQLAYLAAGALGGGCCGIGAFYDEEARRLLGLDAETRLAYLAAAGPLKKWSEPAGA